MSDTVEIWLMIGAVVLSLCLGSKAGYDLSNSEWEKNAAKHGYGYFNENKEFVWK